MSNEELESQLSAMFDDELPAPECELLARRLARDEQLRARWGRYAAIGACIRNEPGIRFQTTLASKVSAAVKHEVTPAEAPAVSTGKRGFFNPWVTSLAGFATAASVAAVAILWMRTEDPRIIAQTRSTAPAAVPVTSPLATTSVAPQLVATSASAPRPRGPHEPDSYVTPARVAQGPALVPPTELANYIVAHSAYSGPLMRRNALSALIGSDTSTPQPTAQPAAATVVTGK